MNFCFQRKKKYLKIFTTKDQIKQMNHLKKNDYTDLKYPVSSIDQETDFSELKDPVAFLDNIRKGKISIEEARQKQEELNWYLKINMERK